MKVLIIAASAHGGAGIAAHRLFRALRDRGDQVRFLSLSGDPESPSEGLWVDQFQGARRRAVKAWQLLSAPVRQAIEDRRWAGRDPGLELFSKNTPAFDLLTHPWYREADVVHFHWAHQLFPWSSSGLTRGPKAFLTLHDQNWLTGGCHYTGGCPLFTTHCERCPQLVGTRYQHLASQQFRSKQAFVRRNPTYVRGLIGPSRWMEDQAKASSLWAGVATATIPNAHDTTVYRPWDKQAARNLWGLRNDQPVLVIVGHALANRRKGFDLLAPLMIQAPGQWVAVGRPSSALPPQVRQVGVIHDELLMVALLNAADVLLVPSREENYSNLILEARLCGTPVVAFDVGGNRDAVVPGHGGVLAGAVDSAAMAQALQQALSRPWDRDALAAQAAQTVNFATIADQHRAFYRAH